MTQQDDSILRNHAFLSGLNGEQIQSLAGYAIRVMFEENEIAMRAGEPSDSFYFLISGSVAVELRGSRFALCVQALSPGDVFGWSALLEHQDTLFQVRAREATVALRIPGATLKALCRQKPELGVELLDRTLQVVARRVRATEARFAEMCGVRSPVAGAGD